MVATDINNDGLLDLFVANDTVQNFLFVNRGDGQVGRDRPAPPRWASARTASRAPGMGVDAADVDGDGWQDLFVANVDQEMFSLYRNNKDESFSDVAHAHGIGQATRLLSGWGLKFFDYDNDGHVDLFLANGHPDDMVDSYGGQVRYKEPLLLFRNDGTRLRDVSARGRARVRAGRSRRAAWPSATTTTTAALDVLVGNNGGAPLLLRNRAGAGQPLGRPAAGRHRRATATRSARAHLVGRAA